MIDEPSLPMIAGQPDGRVYGWMRYLATTVAAVRIPLAAALIRPTGPTTRRGGAGAHPPAGTGK